MKNNNGFTLVETITALTILLFITIAILPLLSEVRTLQYDLYIKRSALSHLHDTIHSISPGSIPSSMEDPVHPITYKFIKEGSYIKGCAQWQANNMEEVCLFAYNQG